MSEYSACRKYRYGFLVMGDKLAHIGGPITKFDQKLDPWMDQSRCAAVSQQGITLEEVLDGNRGRGFGVDFPANRRSAPMVKEGMEQTTMSYKLYIPGPVEVSAKTYAAMTTPVFGHRSTDFVELYHSVQPRLQTLFMTADPVFLSTSSAWGVMEGALRNLVGKKVLNICSGAFSDKWFDVAKRCGFEAEALQYEWGTPVDPADVRAKLATGEFDVLTLIHNETSTGTMNPLAEIMAVVREFPDVITVVDTVSSFSALAIDKDGLGIDVMLTGSQKALALPPGLALFSVSERAFARARTISGRGYYFDFLEFLSNHEKGMTPSTPTIPHIFALRSKLEDIFAEGLEARFARHARLNGLVHAWMERHGLETLPPREYASRSLSCIKNRYSWDLQALNRHLKTAFKCVIDGGYGKLKGKTFRISNMGDETDASMGALLDAMDQTIEVLGLPRA